MHISYEGGVLEDPAKEPLSGMCTITADPEKAPDKAVRLEIEFKNGIKVLRLIVGIAQID